MMNKLFMPSHPAIRHRFEPPNGGVGARRLPISAWQIQFWKKDIIKLQLQMRPRRPAKPFMKRTNVNKNFKSVSPRKRLFRFALYGLASCAFGCLPFALSATTANVSIVNFAFSPPALTSTSTIRSTGHGPARLTPLPVIWVYGSRVFGEPAPFLPTRLLPRAVFRFIVRTIHL